MTDHLSGRTAWVIGASSGIGAATAQELIERGVRVMISARRADALDTVAKGGMETLPFDVSDADAAQRAWTQVQERFGVPDLVIFCAGMWKQTPKGTFSAQDFQAHIEVHLSGLARVLDAVVPAFVARGSGTIVSVASVAGYRGLPGGEYYGPVKAAQINLFEALRGSLAPSGVEVVTVCPGFVETDMTSNNSFPMPFMVSPQRAAREICDGLEAGKPEIIFPKRMMVAMKAARLLPVRAWKAVTTRV